MTEPASGDACVRVFVYKIKQISVDLHEFFVVIEKFGFEPHASGLEEQSNPKGLAVLVLDIEDILRQSLLFSIGVSECFRAAAIESGGRRSVVSIVDGVALGVGAAAESALA